MSNDARDAILGTLRQSARPPGSAPVARPGPHTRPAWAGSPVTRLRERLQARSASVETLAGGTAAIPEAVLRYLASHGLPGRLTCTSVLHAVTRPPPSPPAWPPWPRPVC